MGSSGDPWRQGSLEAVRLTGDLRKPIGKLTFLVPDLSATVREVHGLANTIKSSTFPTQPVLPAKYTYRQDSGEDSVYSTELTLIDQDTLAILYSFNQVGTFHRVDISSLGKKARTFDFF